MKVRGHLNKIEKEQLRIKQEKLSNLSGNSSLKKMYFWRFNEHLPHFQFNSSSQSPEFENIYTLTTLNKTLNNCERINNASETCQDECGLSKVLNTEDKRNENLIVLRISPVMKKKAML